MKTLFNLAWYGLLFTWLLYSSYNTSSHFATGTHGGYRITHSKRASHILGDWDIQDVAYRAAHPAPTADVPAH